MPLVSLILTVHNRVAWVERSLDSLAAQTHRPLELIIVDNASTDGSRERVRQWVEAHHRPDEGLSCRLIDQPLPGVCATRNRGLRAAGGEWVAFFDDDDEMSPRFVEQLLCAAQTAGAAWVTTRTRMVMPDGTERVRTGWARPTAAEHLLASIVSTQSFLARRSLLLDVGGWDERLPCWNDYELGLRLLLADPQPAWDDTVHHRIYQHPAGLTGSSMSGKFDALRTAFHALRTDLRAAAAIDRTATASALRALYLRREVVRGLLHREGRSDLDRQLARDLPFPELRTALVLRTAATFLRHHTARGGRGAWRIARHLI